MTGLLLGIDSCGVETTLALAELTGDTLRVVGEDRLAARTAAALLTGSLAALLGDARPGGIVVVRGPGSFTGMRVGLSTAKALAEACAVPLLGVSRLAVLADAVGGGPVMLHAGRGRIYLRENRSERLLDAAEAAAYSLESATIAEENLLGAFPRARLVPAPTAADALRFALPRVLAGDWDEAAELDAHYLWRSEQMLQSPA